MITTIQKWGNSQGIRIPKIYLESMGVAENDQVEIIEQGDVLLIKKVTGKKKKHKTLKERLSGYHGTYQFEEADWGNPEGNEVF